MTTYIQTLDSTGVHQADPGVDVPALLAGVVGGTLYSDALAPAGQPGDSYIGLFRHNVPALAAAMLKN